MLDKRKIEVASDINFNIKIVMPQDINEYYLETLNDKTSTKFLAKNTNKDYAMSDLAKYVQTQLNIQDVYLFGLYVDGDLIATSRVHDICDNNAWQGVLVFKQFQKMGYGKLIVDRVSDFMLRQDNVETVSAGILSDNIPSMKVFLSSGFAYKCDDQVYGNRQIWVKSLV